MNKTLIIYDSTGKIWAQKPGDYIIPSGIPYLEVEIPTGKYVASVDVSGSTPTAVLLDYPKSAESVKLEDVASTVDGILTDIIPVIMGMLA